jgi:5-methylcytosine-specific restriction protein A
MRNPPWQRDEVILALDLYFNNELGPIDSKNPKIIDLSNHLNRLPILSQNKNEKTFRNPNGVTLKLLNFKAIDPNYSGKGMQKHSKLDVEVFFEFNKDLDRLKKIAKEIRNVLEYENLLNDVSQIEDDELLEGDSVKEGRILYKMHKVRERNKKIIEKKKKKVLKDLGTLNCEACNLNFEEKYGKLGKGFIECHHIIPLSNFEVNKETRLDDLALLCSNCHKMIHKDLMVSSIEEFKQKWLKSN